MDTVPRHLRPIDRVLQNKGYNLRDWLADQAEEGISYREMSRRLYEFTDGVVEVSYETLRRWVKALGIEGEAV